MTISSRTPDGLPNRCPVCRKRLRLSPSWPTADAPCPHCGSLVWFPPAETCPLAGGPALAAEFNLDDFRKQLAWLRKLGPTHDLLARMPVSAATIPKDEDPDREFRRIQGMLDAMTAEERANPEILDAARRRRVAAGAGVRAHEIDQFLEQFGQIRGIMQQMAGMSVLERIRMFTGLEPPFDPGDADDG